MAGSFPLHTEKGQASVFKLPSKKLLKRSTSSSVFRERSKYKDC
uniref:Uncharacterized protein n=1 Tax=Anguilla anguilla TaxID=7936 RepID=A0A0E9UY82_ANGAN